MINKYPLKGLRVRSPLRQQEVANLLDMKPSNLVRYEHGNRNPTPELLLTYHFLFEASLKDLFKPYYCRIAETLKERSQKLINDLESQQSPKSMYRLSFMRSFVNRLNKVCEYVSRD
jgi:transcriptional regulator with XRE-family HTH domain